MTQNLKIMANEATFLTMDAMKIDVKRLLLESVFPGGKYDLSRAEVRDCNEIQRILHCATHISRANYNCLVEILLAK